MRRAPEGPRTDHRGDGHAAAGLWSPRLKPATGLLVAPTPSSPCDQASAEQRRCCRGGPPGLGKVWEPEPSRVPLDLGRSLRSWGTRPGPPRGSRPKRLVGSCSPAPADPTSTAPPGWTWPPLMRATIVPRELAGCGLRFEAVHAPGAAHSRAARLPATWPAPRFSHRRVDEPARDLGRPGGTRLRVHARGLRRPQRQRRPARRASHVLPWGHQLRVHLPRPGGGYSPAKRSRRPW